METNSGHFFLKCFFLCVCVLAFVDLICINKVRTSTGFGDWQACVPCPRYHGWLTSIENGMDMLEMFSHPSSPPCFIWLAMQATPSEKIKKRVWQLIFFLVYIVACPRAEPASQPKAWEIRYRFLQPSKELKWSGMFHLNAMQFSSAFLYRVVSSPTDRWLARSWRAVMLWLLVSLDLVTGQRNLKPSTVLWLPSRPVYLLIWH